MTNEPDLPSTIPIEHSVDVRRDICPMTFVRVRLMLDRLSAGAVLEVLYSGDEPGRNLPQSAVEQGHSIISHSEGRIILRKG